MAHAREAIRQITSKKRLRHFDFSKWRGCASLQWQVDSTKLVHPSQAVDALQHTDLLIGEFQSPPMIIRTLIVCLTAILVVLASHARADVSTATAAYQRGDFAAAFREFSLLAPQGDPVSQAALGFLYADGKGVPQNYQAAARWYRLSADQGNAWAQWNLGFFYARGTGVTQNDEEAVKWYRLAANQGNAEAQFFMGVMYANGKAVPQNEAEAAAWYRRAADQGNEAAQNNLGAMYSSGRGVLKSISEAVKWYRKAADQGYSVAQTNLGFMYSNGRGVAHDDEEAVKWYRLAAAQGDAQAQNFLGYAYYLGQGVHKDYKQALDWYWVAAENGNAYAQFNLGQMYAYGTGVPENRVVAYALYNLSATNDPSDENNATRFRRTLAAQLTPGEIEKGQALTRQVRSPSDLSKVMRGYLSEDAINKPDKRRRDVGKPVTVRRADPYPARPAKVTGVTSCRTNCTNASCYRTYDDGRKVHFLAKPKWNAFSNHLEFDSGTC
jgi:TPR repeat protein